MKSSVETLDGNKVKLSVEVDETEFDRAVDDAFRKLGRELRVPGFRPGKAPRRLLEARLGSDTARQEALRDSVPNFYERALREHDVEPVAPPDIDITAGRDQGPVSFDAVVEVMPEVRVAGYEGLRVALPNLEVTEAEVDAQVDRLREQYGELRAVDRQARAGDHVSIDRKVSQGGEVVLSADDELYEVGSETIVPELDDQLRGAGAGDVLKFQTTLAIQGDLAFDVLVKEVREKILPEVTDEWAAEASEFDTVEELRHDIRARTDAVKRLEAALAVRDKVVEALVELVDDDMPTALVASETERRREMLIHRLGHQGIELGQYLQLTGTSPDRFVAQLQEEAIQAIKADLALRFVAEAEGIEVTDDDISEEVVAIAQRRKLEPAEVRRQLENEDRLPEVRSGIRRSKALEWLIDHTEYVDQDGRIVDRAALQPSSPEGPDDRGSDPVEGQQQEQETPE